ncbi:MAG: 5-formyltetrahydrofolate cyclo-ligase [Maribacter sp.]
MLKKDLRIKYTNLRNSLAAPLLESQSISIANAILKIPMWEFEFYHLFLPIKGKKEINSINILSILQGKDKNILVPKVISKEKMVHYLLTDSTKFKNSTWGVPEPVDGITVDPLKIDVVFIPLMAFDKNGNRVGYGKGYYDRFLSECRLGVIKIGLSLFEAEEHISDSHEEDISMDYCVTPNKIYTFGDS